MSKSIYNLTGSRQSTLQLLELPSLSTITIRNLLQFDEIPTKSDLEARSELIAMIAK